MLQTSVETVNPGGTGNPALVISARPDPLPPSRSFMWRLPSAFPDPKKYTYFLALPVGCGFSGVFRAAGFFGIRRLRQSNVQHVGILQVATASEPGSARFFRGE